MISKHFFFMSQAIKKYNSEAGSGEVLSSGQLGLFEGVICALLATVLISSYIVLSKINIDGMIFICSLLILAALFNFLLFFYPRAKRNELQNMFTQFPSKIQRSYLVAAIALTLILILVGILYLLPRAADIHSHKKAVSAAGTLVSPQIENRLKS